MRRVLVLCGFLLFLTAEQTAHAQPVEEFYRGRNVTLTVGYSTGGGYDTYARILARHMGRHIPGNPTIVVQNAPGAGSMRAANTIYNVAPKDGSAFGMVGRGIALEPLIGSTSSPQPARPSASAPSAKPAASPVGTAPIASAPYGFTAHTTIMRALRPSGEMSSR